VCLYLYINCLCTCLENKKNYELPEAYRQLQEELERKSCFERGEVGEMVRIFLGDLQEWFCLAKMICFV
jgi:hypothetical protein